MDNKPTKERVVGVLDYVEALDLPDGAHWALMHEMLELEYGDLFPLMHEYELLEEDEDDE